MPDRMRISLCVLLTAACAIADTNQNRRTKLPYIADAVGNSLPPPSSAPATVGSPVNLLTPDRYEFYTFDESGELVKRLMTLEEIQAIVAAGEETDGLVTFANDNQPTIAFNFSQPSHTKVHSVVTNVKNVLKAQMEAHKKNPNIQPTFDTPDVSDSWSLILPSIFGNTGADIVPDKVSNSFITPETETIEIESLNPDFEISQSKENNEIPTVPSSETSGETNDIPVKPTSASVLPSMDFSSTVVITSITPKPTTPTPIAVTTTQQSSQKTSTTTTRTSTNTHTTKRPKIPASTTISTTLSTTTVKSIPTMVHKTTETLTTEKSIENNNYMDTNVLNNDTSKITLNSTSVKPIQYEKVSTYVPTTTVVSVTEKSKTPSFGQNNLMHSDSGLLNSGLNNLFLTSNQNTEFGKTNLTTITTQSVSPFTTATSTEFIPVNKSQIKKEELLNTMPLVANTSYEESQTSLPLFDVAQSISQIASDLGSNFAPLPTSNSLLDTTKINSIDIESKENIEIDIPTESTNESELEENQNNHSDNFVKISTFDPQEKLNHKQVETELIKESQISTVAETSTIIVSTTSSSIIDPILSVSMDDLLSQVVHANPEPTSIVFSENVTRLQNDHITTDKENDLYQKQETTIPVIPTEDVNNISDFTTEPTIMTTENLPLKVNKLNSNFEPTSTINILSDLKNVTESPAYNNKLNVKVNQTSDVGSEEKKKQTDSENGMLITSTESNVQLTTVKSILSTEKSKIALTLADKVNVQEVKVNNKYHKHKITDSLPKFDEFKKKIQKVNIDEKELIADRNNSWKLIPTVSPPKAVEISKDKQKVEGFYTNDNNDNNKNIVLEYPKENQGLEVTTKNLGEDILQFTELCNELAFRYWQSINGDIDSKRTIVFSPYAITSMLAMMFMGARGGTSGEMNEVLKLDDMVTFNPHFTLKNISDSIETTSASGVAVSAFIRELFSERHKGKILTFYKERAQHFYNGHVEEVNFELISDIIRRRTNLLVKRYTWGKIVELLKSNSINMHPPLSAFSANIFQTDCSGTSVEGRDGEIYFVVSPNVRQRRLVPVPAVVYKSNFLAGYDPDLDATAAALGNTNSIISTLFLMPGQQGNVVHADDLENLEKRLLNSSLSTQSWNGLLRSLLPRFGLELQIPRFSHKSIFNITSTLHKMGLKELFDPDHADLGGINGPSKNLYLSDMIQLTTFATCGEGVIGDLHHVEEYPETLDTTQRHRTSRWLYGWDEPGDYQRAFHDPHDVGDAMHLPLHLRPRQARLPARNSQPNRLKFDRPFLFFVRHNPSGMILYVGRYNPRLLP